MTEAGTTMRGGQGGEAGTLRTPHWGLLRVKERPFDCAPFATAVRASRMMSAERVSSRNYPTQICGGPGFFAANCFAAWRKSCHCNTAWWQKRDSGRHSMSHCFGCNPMKTNAGANF